MSDLPDRVRRILPADTAATWLTLAPSLPRQVYLGGGTAVAVHLAHRESRDPFRGEGCRSRRAWKWWSARQVRALRSAGRFG